MDKELQKSVLDTAKLKIAMQVQEIDRLTAKLEEMTEWNEYLEKELEELQEYQEEAEKELEDLRRQNAKMENSLVNFTQIMREKNNAKQGLPGRKTHPGYVLLSCREIVEHYTVEKAEINEENEQVNVIYERKSDTAWETVLQTPFSISIPDYEAKERILQDIVDKVMDDYLEFVEQKHFGDFSKAEGCMSNTCYRWLLSQDVRKKLWKISLYTTEPLKVAWEVYPVEK